MRFGADTPGPEFRGNLRERGRRSPARGAQRSDRPLGSRLRPGEAQKPTFPPGLRPGDVRKPTFLPGLLHGKAAKPTFPPGVSHGEAAKPTFLPGFRTAEWQSRPFCPDFCATKRESRPFHPALGGAVGALGAKTARFLITREGSKFYETATKGDVFVATSSPLVNLLFCPRRAKLWLRRGKTPPRNPAAPRGLPPTTVTGPRLARRQRALRNPATPPQPACSRRLSGCPRRPTLSAGRPAESPKRENEKKGGTPDGTTAPALPTPGLSRPLRLTMAGRAPSRNAPSVAESPQNQRRRSLP